MLFLWQLELILSFIFSWIYVLLCLLLALLLLVGCILAAFMFPRDVTIRINNCTQINDSITTKLPIDINKGIDRVNISTVILEVEVCLL